MNPTLRDRIAAIVEAMHYEFVGCELIRQGGSALLRIYVDQEKGVTVEDCSKISRQISAMLDVEDPIQGHYTLEVSSPGIDRPLFEMAHFEKSIGKKIKIRVSTPINAQRHLVGTLVRIEGMTIHLLVGSEEKRVPFSEIEKAKLVTNVG